MPGTLILAGGGTGGHVFPLLAIAEALGTLEPKFQLIFVGTQRGMEQKLVPERGYELELLPVLPMRGGGVGGALLGLARAAQLIPVCARILSRTRACGVLSVGGYAAGPMTMAAALGGVPLGIIEPNSVPGLANVLAGPLAKRAYLAFEEAELSFSPAQVKRLGVPIRRGFSRVPYPDREGPVRVLVLGGSQGSKALNEAVPAALALLPLGLEVRHQAGQSHASEVKERYDRVLAGSSISYEVLPFIEDMQAALGWAHLVIGRSGASAVSELLVVGRPSLLVPYPFASGDHQRRNALALEKAGASVCLPASDVTPSAIARALGALLGDFASLTRMAGAAARLGRADAALEIAKDFLSLVKDT